MKRTLAFLFSHLLPFSISAQWAQQSQFLTTNELLDIRMVNADRGAVVGEGNVLLCTIDGGASPWDGGGSFDPDITTASMIAGNIYFGNAAGTIFFESDPATCNNEILAVGSPATDDIIDLHQTDVNTGYLIANEALLFSNNSWASAVQVAPSGCTDQYSAIWFLNDERGFAGTLDGKIIEVTRSGSFFLCNEIASTGNRIRGIHFTDDDHGWAVGNSGTVYRTINSGLSWTNTDFPSSEDLRTVFATSASTVHVAGNGIYRWNASDSQWKQTLSPSEGPSLNAIWFANENDGWAVGVQGYITATNNGGGIGQVVVGIGDGRIPDFEVSPTVAATSSVLLLELPESTAVEFFSLQGIRLYQAKHPAGLSQIKLPAFAPGMYLLKAGNSVRQIVLY